MTAISYSITTWKQQGEHADKLSDNSISLWDYACFGLHFSPVRLAELASSCS